MHYLEAVYAVWLREITVFFREKADTPFAYKLYAHRHRFDFQFFQVVPAETTTVRQTLKVSPRLQLQCFIRCKES